MTSLLQTVMSELALTHADAAALLGCSRATITRACQASRPLPAAAATRLAEIWVCLQQQQDTPTETTAAAACAPAGQSPAQTLAWQGQMQDLKARQAQHQKALGRMEQQYHTSLAIRDKYVWLLREQGSMMTDRARRALDAAMRKAEATVKLCGHAEQQRLRLAIARAELELEHLGAQMAAAGGAPDFG